jgi:hypothetical protein
VADEVLGVVNTLEGVPPVIEVAWFNAESRVLLVEVRVLLLVDRDHPVPMAHVAFMAVASGVPEGDSAFLASVTRHNHLKLVRAVHDLDCTAADSPVLVGVVLRLEVATGCWWGWGPRPRDVSEASIVLVELARLLFRDSQAGVLVADEVVAVVAALEGDVPPFELVHAREEGCVLFVEVAGLLGVGPYHPVPVAEEFPIAGSTVKVLDGDRSYLACETGRDDLEPVCVAVVNDVCLLLAQYTPGLSRVILRLELCNAAIEEDVDTAGFTVAPDSILCVRSTLHVDATVEEFEVIAFKVYGLEAEGSWAKCTHTDPESSRLLGSF